ncbi:uncharacterized protein [Equus przewalskii]|uniref:Uncharacterized protein n=1 Tax=Equus przewalskii TaxID=9798 RepID=A0ABM4NYM3_EQUPR|nr:PREDICTED: uncharacterized protein LOC103540518 [Equus przewalskii]
MRAEQEERTSTSILSPFSNHPGSEYPRVSLFPWAPLSLPEQTQGTCGLLPACPGWRGGGAGRAARRSLQGSALGGSGSDGSPNLTSDERVLLGELGLCLRKFPGVRARRLGLKRRLGSKGRRSCEGLALPERQLPHLVGKGVLLVPRRWRCCERGSGSTEHTAQHGARHWLVRAHRLPSFPVSIVLSADIRPAPAGRVPAWGRTQQPRTQVPKSLPLGEFAASCLGREDRRQTNTSRREAASPTTGRGAVGNGEPGTAEVLVRHALMASLSFPQPAPRPPPRPPGPFLSLASRGPLSNGIQERPQGPNS